MAERKIKFSYCPYTLRFKEAAGTSRGVLHEKLTFLLRAFYEDSPDKIAYGEVPYFPGLSHENFRQVEDCLKRLVRTSEWCDDELEEISSVRFGVEQITGALANSEGVSFPSPFTSGKTSVTINGLIWMGDFSKMKERVRLKIKEKFDCIKVKIAAIKWDEELELLRFIRDMAGNEVTLRLDANGGFSKEECLSRLEELAQFNIHSVEQPVRQGNYSAMRKICEYSPVPIALDEELIGIPPGPERNELLEFIRPSYIILKPALCYGFTGATDWMERAGHLNIGYWITSALESSVGLNAIAQFTGKLQPSIPQGLGTGNLYVNNFISPLTLIGDKLHFSPGAPTYNNELEKLSWIG